MDYLRTRIEITSSIYAIYYRRNLAKNKGRWRYYNATKYPVADDSLIDVKIEKSFEYIKEVVSSLRNIRAEREFLPAKPAKVVVSTSNSEELETLEKNELFIKKLANLEKLTCGTDLEAPSQSSLRVAGKFISIYDIDRSLNNEAEIKKRLMNNLLN